MRTIDILTTQNVTINYELAEVKDRVFATVVDLLLMILTLLLLSLVFISSGLVSRPDYIYMFVFIPILIFYHLFFEIILDGQTPAKKLMGLKIVKLTGTEPSLNDYLMRWAFRPVDILFSVGSIGIMLISSSEKGQRLGDIVANTAVIKIKPSQSIRLKDILNIRSLENYVPTYPQVRLFTEQDMLLLKEVMDRYQKYQNKAHLEALTEAALAVKERLGLSQLPSEKITFIRTLIKDYVALSR